MAGLGDIVQKAFYLGVGLAAAAGEQAGEKFSSIGIQAQKLADEMVAKGEITTEEARKLVARGFPQYRPLARCFSSHTRSAASSNRRFFALAGLRVRRGRGSDGFWLFMASMELANE